MNVLLKERSLFFALALLIFLTLLIGLVAIFQIHGLNQRIEDLGRHHLKLESAVLGMRIKNANYAREIRSYLFWRVARQQDALPMTEYVDSIAEAEKGLKNELEVYRETARSDQQKEWGNAIDGSLREVFDLGNKVTHLADKEASEKISKSAQDWLMLFEKRVYELDQFLNNPMGRSNLLAIQGQIYLAKGDKEHAISFLSLSLAGALFLGTLIGISTYYRNINERANRRDILNRMMDVEEHERRKLSTAVHDEMGQDLSALKIRLGLIGQIMGPGPINENAEMGPGPIMKHLEECKKITADLIKKSHNIAFLLRPPDLDEVGLLESLEALLLECKHMTGVSYEYTRQPDFPALSPEYALLFYRITQELLTNTIKYAKAKHVDLTLAQKSSAVELSYADDGRGFDHKEVLEHPARRHEDKLRLGLLGLKERVELLDGTMKIHSGSGRGTRVVVQLPL